MLSTRKCYLKIFFKDFWIFLQKLHSHCILYREKYEFSYLAIILWLNVATAEWMIKLCKIIAINQPYLELWARHLGGNIPKLVAPLCNNFSSTWVSHACHQKILQRLANISFSCQINWIWQVCIQAFNEGCLQSTNLSDMIHYWSTLSEISKWQGSLLHPWKHFEMTWMEPSSMQMWLSRVDV